MKKIDGLKKMNCAEIIDVLIMAITDAALEAERVSNEIEKAYTEKDGSDKAMHEAAAKKDIDAYRRERTNFDMLTEYIDKQERTLYTLRDGCILDRSDAEYIRDRMFDECSDATRKTAAKINKLYREALQAVETMNTYISERNKVLLRLYDCTRPKYSDGSPRDPDYYVDAIINPVIREVEQNRSPAKANYRVYISGLNGSKLT